MIDIKDLEQAIEESFIKWIDVEINENEKVSLKYVKMNNKQLTRNVLLSGVNGLDEREISIDLIFNSFRDWKNVKLKHTISEELADTLIENGKITQEDLDKEVNFSSKLFDNFILNYNLSGSIIVEFNKINSKKKNS